MQAVKLSEREMRDVEDMQQETVALLKALCAIPAPSGHEERRAQAIRAWFESRGMHAFIDEAKNVLCPMGLNLHEEIIVVAAHTDTVFADMEPMPMREENGQLLCPGVGDDTANLAAMMCLAAYLRERKPRCGVLFAADAGEEGLGNLKGCKAIMRAYGSRVKAFLSLDGGVTHLCSHAVGSTRYRITARTKGGHSFADFGSRNAIAVLADVISALYKQELPRMGITTYNVGCIEGGTSVNAIAQEAHMLYEYRSDTAACLRVMQTQLKAILDRYTPPDAQIEVEVLGERPCAAQIEPEAQRALETTCFDALQRYAGTVPVLSAGSTDCNIPLSLGIPSVSFGVYRGGGAHTREEWVDLASLCGGMQAALSVLLNWFE